MYSLIIVDDHNYLIEGMRKFVNWRELGIDIINVASDGEQGLQMIRENHPDIVITDISMPIMDGLDMIRILRQEEINSKIIIITGYSEFEYAKEAVRYGVIDYIVKPALPKDIKEILKRVICICDEEKRQKSNEAKMKQRLMESKPLLIERFMEDLFQGNINNEIEMKKRTDLLEIKFEYKHFRVITVQIDYYNIFIEKYKDEDREFLKYSILSTICDYLNIVDYFVNFKERTAHILLASCESFKQEESDKALLANLTTIINKCQELYDITISVGVGDGVESPYLIKKSYNQSAEYLKYKISFGNGQVIFNKDVEQLQLDTSPRNIYDRSKLIEGLELKSQERIECFLYETFSILRSNKYLRTDYIKVIVIEIINITLNVQLELGEKPMEIDLKLKLAFDTMEHMESLDEIEDWVRRFFKTLFCSIGEKGKSKNSKVIGQILDYIKENYYSDISINKLSKQLFFTPNYLGNIFSKQMQKSFNEYLVEYRVERAKEFLSTGNYRIYEVGEKVGYKDINYFRRVFKEHVGVSPSEYMK